MVLSQEDVRPHASFVKPIGKPLESAADPSARLGTLARKAVLDRALRRVQGSIQGSPRKWGLSSLPSL